MSHNVLRDNIQQPVFCAEVRVKRGDVRLVADLRVEHVLHEHEHGGVRPAVRNALVGDQGGEVAED